MPQLHKSQEEARRINKRFKILANGRRWGKTRLGTTICMQYGLSKKLAWWVAPTYKMARVGWRGLALMSNQIPGAQIRQGDRIIRYPGGGEVHVRSADDPDSLRGEGLNLVVFDEAPYAKADTWNYVLVPALADKLGKAILIGTPKGRNWFYHLFNNAIDDPDWARWQLPTSDNPFISKAEIERAKNSMPSMVFNQEYLAEFISDNAAVFRNVYNCVDDDIKMRSDGFYVIGVDWGQVNDFTVLCVMHSSGQVVEIDRFNQVGWEFQRNRLAVLTDKYNAFVLVESNSIGSPNLEALQLMGINAVGFETTHKSKAPLIMDLALALEREQIKIPDNQILINELISYESRRTPSGSWQYSAPSGSHDDTVIALALAWRAVADSRVFISDII